MLNIRCPSCSSGDVRASMPQGFGERLGRLFGFFQIRCKDCDERFTSSIWAFTDALFAKCPRCYRLDLSTWTTHYYRAPTIWLVAMKLGARRHRCEYCRHNFISWRPAKLRFRRRQPAQST